MLESAVVLKSVALVAVLAYAGISAWLWYAQERLLFFPQPAQGKPSAPKDWTLEPVHITARDGKRLAGVLVLPGSPGPDRHPLLIFHGGNAEEVTMSAVQAPAFGPRALLLVNYRGYGESEGEPSETALVADALSIYDWARSHPRLDPARIAVHGRSLGSAVAVRLAAERPVKCVVLTSPMDSVRAVAQTHYPWLPVSFILRHPFDSLRHAPGIRAPALVLVAGDDRIIAPRHSERLASAWGGSVERVGFPGRDHNELELEEQYFKAIARFLDRCL